MRKTLVFVSAFALVLVAGAAFAFMSTPEGDEPADVPPPIEKPAAGDETATTEVAKDKESEAEPEPVTEEKVEFETDKEEPVEHEKEQEEEPEAKDTDPPDIEILHPKDGQRFDTREVVVEGKAEPGAHVYVGQYDADTDEEGNFRIVLVLTHDGANGVHVKARDASGNVGSDEVTAYYDAPREESKPDKESSEKDEPDQKGFTAHQKFGSCEEDLPYDKWYGTGEPGTKIWVVSEFGEGSTTVGEHGEWHLRVDFPESPCNDTFGVVLETDEGHRRVYEFTRICDGGGEDSHSDEK